MKRSIMPAYRLTLLAAAAALICSAAVPAQTPAADGRFAITGMQAKLFFPESGAFSEDMLAASDLSLWNTIIGAGWAKHPSNATLVLVEVAGPPRTSPDSLSMELVVTDARKGGVQLRRRIEINSSVTGKRQEAFWLYDTGCLPLVLRARLIGQPRSPVIEKRLPFECGE